MREETRRAVRDAWDRAREQGTPDGAPVRVDGRVYADRERFRREEERVFARAWLPVARAEELREVGAYRTFDLAGTPAALLRGEDGRLRARVNVCRHRGAQILRDETGVVERPTCPYHGFAYDLEGRCVARPVPTSFEGQDAEPLPALDLEEWGGWAWVRRERGGGGLRTFLGEELLDELEEWPFERAVVLERRALDGAFDWKIGVEAFLESLHLPTIHGATANPLLDHRGLATRILGDHSRMSTPFRSRGAYSPDGPMGRAASDAGVDVFASLNAVQRESNFSYLIFPSTILNLLPTHFTCFRILPSSAGHCRIMHELYGEPPRTEAAREYFRSLQPGYDRLLAEDLENLPWIQRGVASGSIPELALGRYESRIPAFREALERWGA